ncbi:MAG: aspartate/glutamate racemase family protein [Nanoarchaeota archaeon]
MVKIGVLGGIGPESSARYYLKFIERLQDSGYIRSNQDYPQIIINSIPAPDITSKSSDQEDMQQYIRGLEELNVHQPDFIAIVCNSAYVYSEELRKHSTARILDLGNAVRNRIFVSNRKKVGILGTPNTVLNHLYRVDGIEYVNPTSEELAVLSGAILNFNNGIRKEEQARKVMEVASGCIGRGAELIVYACTEISLMLSNKIYPHLDTLDVLVDLTFENYSASKA